MRDLTTKQHWDRVWDGTSDTPGQRPASPLRRIVRRVLGPRVLALKNAHNNEHLWREIYPRFLPQDPALSVIEIGSAPGLRLIEFRARLGYTPFGVEYSETGVEANRRLFREHGLPEENVIHADFFADDFQDRYRDRFDIVISWSFLEHFADPVDVVRKHAAILKPGGTLIVMIPFLRGVYGPLIRFFRPQWLDMHNFEIMDRRRYAALFAEAGLDQVHCDYHGLFSFQKLQTLPDSPKRHILRVLQVGQLALNVLFNLVFPRRGPENGTFSQELLYLGRKPARE
jgi:SAM-dependent methyltransferase